MLRFIINSSLLLSIITIIAVTNIKNNDDILLDIFDKCFGIDTCDCCDQCDKSWITALSDANNKLTTANSKVTNLEIEKANLINNNTTLSNNLKDAKSEIKRLRRLLKERDKRIERLVDSISMQGESIRGILLRENRLKEIVRVLKQDSIKNKESIKLYEDSIYYLSEDYYKMRDDFSRQSKKYKELSLENSAIKSKYDRLFDEATDVINLGKREAYFGDETIEFESKKVTKPYIILQFKQGIHSLNFDKLKEVTKERLLRFTNFIKRNRGSQYKIEILGWCYDKNLSERVVHARQRAELVKQILIKEYNCTVDDFSPVKSSRTRKNSRVDIMVRIP